MRLFPNNEINLKELLVVNLQITLQEALRKISNEMQSIFDDKLKDVILFGSYARGDYDKYSDVDIMVLVDIDRYELTKYRKIVQVVRQKIDEEYNYEFLITILLQDEETFIRYKSASGFFKNIILEGITISA